MLSVSNISFAYHKEPILKNLSFKVEQGKHLSIIGESGSGKSTLLKLLYGKYDLNEGTLYWKDKQILGPKYSLITGPPFMKYVAQEFDLMPFTTVADNVGEFLSIRYPIKRSRRIKELIKVVGLEDVSQSKVKHLSGGQKQRVALAKALALKPEVLLLDEPFSHIDNFKKHQLRRSLFLYLKENRITCIVATHDKEDVLGYADKMLVLDHGKSSAFNTPESLYAKPENQLIASFFDEYNTFRVSEISQNNKNNKPFFVYAHQVEIVSDSGLKAQVVQSFFKGDYYLIEAMFNTRSIFINHSDKLEKGQKICFKINVNLPC